MNWRVGTGVAAAALVACGGPFSTSDEAVDGGAATGAPPPQVTVVTPTGNQGFEFDDEDEQHHGDDQFDVEVHVEHASLADPGKCTGSGPCGHLVLLIDGVACGNPNTSSSSTKFKGKFGRCVTVSGPHQIVVQLVDDRGDVLASTAPITVTVTLKGHHHDAQTGPPPGGDDRDDGDDHGDHHGDHHGEDDHGGDDDSGHH